MSWWMPQNSRWCEWSHKFNTVYSSYDAHDNPVYVYLCLFASDWLRGIHNLRIILCFFIAPPLIIGWKDKWIDEWMGMKKMEMWVNGGTNEWTSSEQKIYIYISCVNIEWMSWWMPQNSRWCEWNHIYIIQFILVMTHMITRYMCTYCLQNCP